METPVDIQVTVIVISIHFVGDTPFTLGKNLIFRTFYYIINEETVIACTMVK